MRDAAGNVYGTTLLESLANRGVVFRVTAAGKQTVVYSFNGLTDGSSPTSGVILDSSDDLYGTSDARVYKLDAAELK